MPITPTVFHSANKYAAKTDLDKLEFEPLEPEGPDKALGCCKCSEGDFCERESILPKGATMTLGASVGTFVGA